MTENKRAFLQAFGVSFYCFLVGLLMWKGNDLFGKTPGVIGPAMFLVLFIVSALVCALLVFYKPYQLFIANKGEEALQLVIKTTLWLFIFFLLFLELIVILT